MTIRLSSPSGAPLSPKELVVALSNPSSGIEQFERHAVQAGPGSWRVEDLVLPVAGSWRVQIDVLVSDFDEIKLEGEIKIPAS